MPASELGDSLLKLCGISGDMPRFAPRYGVLYVGRELAAQVHLRFIPERERGGAGLQDEAVEAARGWLVRCGVVGCEEATVGVPNHVEGVLDAQMVDEGVEFVDVKGKGQERCDIVVVHVVERGGVAAADGIVEYHGRARCTSHGETFGVPLEVAVSAARTAVQNDERESVRFRVGRA